MSRTQHYVFAHQWLPATFFAIPERMVGDLLANDATDGIRHSWDRLGARLAAAERLDPVGLEARVVPVHEDDHSDYYAIVTLPEPQAVPEAYFVGMVVRPVDGELVAEEVSGTVREGTKLWYFTLERSVDSDLVTPSTVLCAWHEGTHLNFGEAVEPTMKDFLGAITRRVSESDDS